MTAKKPPPVPARHETHADWAAVHEARRAYRVAWISVLLNAVVIAVALVGPYIQSHIDEQKKVADYAKLKSMYLRTMKREYEELAELSGASAPDLSTHGATPISGSERRFLISQVQGLRNTFTGSANIIRGLFAGNNQDADFIRLGAIVASPYVNLEAHSFAAESELRFLNPMRGAGAANIIKEWLETADYQTRELRLIIDLNTTPDGEARSGPMIFGACDAAAFARDCARPLGRYLPPTEAP